MRKKIQILFWSIIKKPIHFYQKTRMHSSRMRIARSLTISPYLVVFAPPHHAHPLPCTPPTMHAPPAIHAPYHAHPSCHVCPCHACPLPHMPPAMHAPLPCMPFHHACPLHDTCPPATHAPPAMHAPHHTHPTCGETHTCKNITFTNFICGR